MGVEPGKAFTPREGDTLYFEIISVLDETILPSLSYLDCNCCIAEEIWNLVKFYPYQIRYGFLSISSHSCENGLLGIVCMPDGKMIHILFIPN